VNTEGVREVLGMAIGPSEAEPFWTGFLRSPVTTSEVPFSTPQ
jgi:transposase-like protein